MFELSNEQRKYLGLEDIKPEWDRVILKANPYTPETIIYFEGDVIRRHILSTDEKYFEKQYYEQTQNREFLMPKTSKGKPVKLTVSTLESKTPIGVYFYIDQNSAFTIGNFTTQHTFYAAYWENEKWNSKDIEDTRSVSEKVNDFINLLPANHLESIRVFKTTERKNVKYKTGDFFAFKASLNEYGFGRILLDINQLRERKIVPQNHGFFNLMGHALLVKIYAHLSESNRMDLDELRQMPSLPSGYVMDNHLFYGEYEIIGNRTLRDEEFDFPMSYGRTLRVGEDIKFQWGLIHKEMPIKDFDKYLYEQNEQLEDNNPSKKIHNPYANVGIGFSPWSNTTDIRKAIKNGGNYDFSMNKRYDGRFDLRDPANKSIRDEIMLRFGLDPTKGYEENSKLTGTTSIQEVINQISKP